ncbi:MAG: drug resistance transporter, EmrB/QacA family [Brockia lithotrophica]|uniref:Drug resistance transporter, EmrB/QacA family n=1 Tax=Brockia lithotrophica TaxID=933949 RepID=A0A2T5G790_9BACL|nr:MAG: drug resistance transporter, EmrB/QacA family [Brockia lithotrophica]
MGIQRAGVLAGALLGVFLAAVEATIVSTAMPAIATDLGGLEYLGAVFSVYMLTSAVTTPVFGRLADRLGRRTAFVSGTLLFVLGSFASGLAPNMPALVSFRALQGFGAGAVLPLATTIVGDLYEGEARARAQALTSSVWAISALVGPLLGAYLLRIGWPWVFWINVPAGLLSVALVGAFLRDPGSRVRRGEPLDARSVLVFTLAVSALVGALELLAVHTRSSWSELLFPFVLAVVGILLLFAWTRIERTSTAPFVPREFWTDPFFLRANLGTFFLGGILIGQSAFLPTYVRLSLGAGTVASGFALTMQSLGWTAASLATGFLLYRAGVRTTALWGAGAFLLGSAGFFYLRPGDPLALFYLASAVVGIGLGTTNTAYLVALQARVPWERRGTATAFNMFVRLLGSAVGAAAFGILVNRLAAWDLRREGLPPESFSAWGGRGVGEAEAVPPLLAEAFSFGMHGVYALMFFLSLAMLWIALRIPADVLSAKDEKT